MSGTNSVLKLEDLHARIEEFLRSIMLEEVLKVAGKGGRSLLVDYRKLEKFDVELADELLNNPGEVIKAFEEVLLDLAGGEHVIKVRFTNLPESLKVRIKNLRSYHLGKLVVVEGIIRQASEVRPEVVKTTWECPVCGNEIVIFQTGMEIEKPKECICGNRKGFILKSKEFTDVQRIVIEENPETLEGGEQPSRLSIILRHDLVDPQFRHRTMPGTIVRVSGVLKEVPLKGKESKRYDIFLEANYIEPLVQEFKELEITRRDIEEIEKIAKSGRAWELVVNSIAPSIYGHERIKEAIALQLFGGVRKQRPDGTWSRGDIHILLVGDPGSGKSQILKYVASLAPKARYVSGKGASAVGLTATVVRDEFLKGWTLEAGALVLANGGIVCIDEMDKISKEDIFALHEAMEQQSYAYDFEILLPGKGKVKIGELVDSIVEKSGKKGLNCELANSKLDVISFDFEKSKIVQTTSIRVSRHEAERELLRVWFENGRFVDVTPEHPFFVLRDSIIEVPAEKLKQGDFVAGIRGGYLPASEVELKVPEIKGRKRVKIPGKLNPDLAYFLGLFAAEGYSYRGNTYELGISTKSKEIAERVKDIARKVFGVEVVDYVEKNRTLRLVSKEIFRFFELNFPQLLEKAAGKRVPPQIFFARKEEKKAFIRGYFHGDGAIESEAPSFSSISRKLLEDVQDLLLDLGVETRLVKDGKRFKLYVRGHSLENFYLLVGDERLRKYVERSRAKNYRNCLPPELGWRIIKLYSKLKLGYDGGLLENLKNGFGITERKFRRYLDKVEERVKELERLCSDFSFERAKELGLSLSFLSRISRVSRNKLRNEKEKVLASLSELVKKVKKELEELKSYLKLRWLRIKKIERIGYRHRWAYDITVEPYKNFISSGLVLHNSITIAKANIFATLKAQTSVLAAANPKYGRFDLHTPIADQINLPETILSRFDLIFPVKDVPNPEKDEALAEHILRLHKAPTSAKPALDPEFMKKYIAYARQNVFPRLSDEAARAIKEFFVGLRRKYADENTVPISARQLEALVRLSEASARLHLRPVVTIEDAQRAIDLMRYTLYQLAFDVETGKLDIDRLEGVMPSSRRSKVMTVLDVIRELEKVEKPVPKMKVIEEASKRGLSEDEVERIIEQLKARGDLIEPRSGFIERVE